MNPLLLRVSSCKIQHMSKKSFRIAKDSMGEMNIPAGMLYGASTQRAVLNFPVSGRRFSRAFIHALGQIKLSAAKANQKLGLLTRVQAKAIALAATSIRDGLHDDQFVLDVFQTGSATSTNMNANEVISNLAQAVSKVQVHPNDHVNLGQSSNDVIPAVIHISTLLELRDKLIPELKQLSKSLAKKAQAFKTIYKIGRTHLQDATPITLGQEFGGYAEQIRKSIGRIERCFPNLRELPIGGTAVGTGINTHPRFAREVCRDLNFELNEKFFEAHDHFEAQSAKDACVETSGALKTLAVSLIKIANDIRWLGCGPRAGIGEIKLPAIQPGSSIMPGKMNPVICESVLQVAAEVIGSDATITYAAASGNFELNTMMPVIVHHLLESIRLLANVTAVFRTKLIDGIEADKAACEAQIEKSLMLSTALVPVIGYDRAAEVSKEAYQKNKTIREVVLEKKLIPPAKLSVLLDVKKLV